MVTRKWVLKQPPHRSDFVNRQRALTMSATMENVTPVRRHRYHVTDKERIQHHIKYRPAHTYRAARRTVEKFNRKVQRNKLKNQAILAALSASMAA